MISDASAGTATGAARCDLLIVGAGPAGMAAAIAARRYGLSVIVAEEGMAPGGQVYRQASDSPLGDATLLGHDYAHGRPLIERFKKSGASLLTHTLVWQIGAGGEAMLTCRGGSPGTLRVQATAILLATGAQERPWPVPGWTLPGVMNAGAAQTLLKSAALVPGADTVIAGSGPLLWLYASQLISAGRSFRAIVDTTPASAYWRAMPQLPRALRATSYLAKGLRMMLDVRRAGVSIYRSAQTVNVLGEQRAEGLRFRVGSKTHEVAAGLVLLHQGVIPGTNLSRSVGCRHRWSEVQACWHAEVDAFGRTSVPLIWIAGDGAAIGGAQLAECDGELAALDIARVQERIDIAAFERAIKPIRARRAQHAAIRPLLDVLYTPPRAQRLPDDDVIVCRCEEVTAGDIRNIAGLGCTGPNQMKAFSRCGMGPCQGRWCGSTVVELIADAQGRTPGDVGYFRIRPPVKPVTIAEIAAAVPADAVLHRGEFPS
jgi:NADPH-dependent 2,4-dienoyl-CoA reductase/sulfur reductase-like enzyme